MYYFSLGSSIFELLPIVFYDLEKEVVGKDLWLDFLAASKLWHYVKNPQLTSHSKFANINSPNWYFIGNLAVD